ncbi:MAG: hypothetical protein E6R03_13370 [Hyphomicrobiaceae bacterium]|nr:MAG: hypothetical protein E6R03_13370 [Hyphomicrobiaceae bacterium]
MTDIMIPPVELIDPRKVFRPTDNPNRMTPDKYAALKKAIATDGFLQPVLVSRGGPAGFEYTIEDGDHRTGAMIDLKAKVYPAMVCDTPDEAKRLARRLGLNRIRGTLDLVDVSRDLLALSQDHGWSMSELEVSGFADDEINSLLRATADTPTEALLGEVPDSEPPSTVRKSSAKRKLTLTFASEVDCIRVKDALLALASPLDDPAVGLLSVLEIDPDEAE